LKKRSKLFLSVPALIAIVFSILPVPNALAVDILEARGRITVDAQDWVACGTVTYDSPQVAIVGEMTAAGFGSTVSTQENALVRDVVPITAFGTDRVRVCTEGLNFVPNPGVVLGLVHWTLTASSESGDVLVRKICGKTPNIGFVCRDV
jgi:hypothetical protein